MDDIKKGLYGSRSRDTFRFMHKKLNPKFYASDGDLILVSFDPPGIVAYLDYKQVNDSITVTEKLLYNEWCSSTPVYIIQGDKPELGQFDIYRYIKSDIREKELLEFSTSVYSWDEYSNWEMELRNQYKYYNGNWRKNIIP